jgi:hypothetical protein
VNSLRPRPLAYQAMSAAGYRRGDERRPLRHGFKLATHDAAMALQKRFSETSIMRSDSSSGLRLMPVMRPPDDANLLRSPLEIMLQCTI